MEKQIELSLKSPKSHELFKWFYRVNQSLQVQVIEWTKTLLINNQFFFSLLKVFQFIGSRE